MSDGCAKVRELLTIQRSCWRELHHCRTSARIGCRFRVFQPVKIQKEFHEICVLFFTSKSLLVLVISRPPKVDCVAFMAQHHHICQIQTGLHVFKIAHEMFFWSRAHHVIQVTQEDRIFRSLCTFLHIRRRIGYQLVVAHVVDFLCAVNTPGHAPIWLLPQQHRVCPCSWSRAPSSRGWLQKRCLLPRGSTRSAESLRHPCTCRRTEVEPQLRRFTTVLDVVSHVLGIRCTSCTRADSESVSDCAVITIWSGVPGSLRVAGRAGIGSSTSSSVCGPIGICNS